MIKQSVSSRILYKTLVEAFYRQHTGLFFVLLYFCLGFLRGEEHFLIMRTALQSFPLLAGIWLLWSAYGGLCLYFSWHSYQLKAKSISVPPPPFSCNSTAADAGACFCPAAPARTSVCQRYDYPGPPASALDTRAAMSSFSSGTNHSRGLSQPTISTYSGQRKYTSTKDSPTHPVQSETCFQPPAVFLLFFSQIFNGFKQNRQLSFPCSRGPYVSPGSLRWPFCFAGGSPCRPWKYNAIVPCSSF